MTEPQVLTPSEVAARLRRSLDWFRRNRRRLCAHGFPEPLPGTYCRLYSAAAVDRWIAGDACPASNDDAKLREAEAFRQRLRARALTIVENGRQRT